MWLGKKQDLLKTSHRGIKQVKEAERGEKSRFFFRKWLRKEVFSLENNIKLIKTQAIKNIFKQEK